MEEAVGNRRRVIPVPIGLFGVAMSPKSAIGIGPDKAGRPYSRDVSIIRDYQRLPETMRDYQRLSETIGDYEKLSETMRL